MRKERKKKKEWAKERKKERECISAYRYLIIVPPPDIIGKHGRNSTHITGRKEEKRKQIATHSACLASSNDALLQISITRKKFRRHFSGERRRRVNANCAHAMHARDEERVSS